MSGTGSECEGGEPEYLLPRTPPLSPREQVPATRHQDTIDPETQVPSIVSLTAQLVDH